MLVLDTSLIVVFLIVWILLALLSKVFFKPLQKVMREREKKIRGNNQSAHEALEKQEEILRKIEEDLKAAKEASLALRGGFEKEAWKEKERMLAEVAKECRKQVERSKKTVGKQVKELKKELEEKAQDYAETLARKLLN